MEVGISGSEQDGEGGGAEMSVSALVPNVSSCDGRSGAVLRAGKAAASVRGRMLDEAAGGESGRTQDQAARRGGRGEAPARARVAKSPDSGAARSPMRIARERRYRGPPVLIRARARSTIGSARDF